VIAYRDFRRVISTAAMIWTLVGCSSVKVEHGVEESPDYITSNVVEAMVSQRVSRQEIIEKLGKPDAESAEAVGYIRCMSTVAKYYESVILPWPTFYHIDDCEFVTIWFGKDGQATDQHIDTYYYLPSETEQARSDWVKWFPHRRSA
jgi:hypothetical protein